MADDLNFMTTGACDREGCACTGSRSIGSGTNSGSGSGSDDDSDSSMKAYTMDDLAEASGLSKARLGKIDDDELEALAGSVLLNDSGGDGGDGDGDEPTGLEDLSEPVQEKLVAIVAKAREAGVDLSELGLDELFDLEDLPEEEAASAALAANGGTSDSDDVSLMVNTRKVAEAHGLPTDWAALDEIDLPPSLADVQMSDKGIAAAINKAHGVDGAGDRIVTPHLVGNVRDKGTDRDGIGASVEDLAANDAGLDNNLDEEQPLPTRTVKNRVEAHLARTGQTSMPDSTGVSLEDVDEGR